MDFKKLKIIFLKKNFKQKMRIHNNKSSNEEIIKNIEKYGNEEQKKELKELQNNENLCKDQFRIEISLINLEIIDKRKEEISKLIEEKETRLRAIEILEELDRQELEYLEKYDLKILLK